MLVFTEEEKWVKKSLCVKLMEGSFSEGGMALSDVPYPPFQL